MRVSSFFTTTVVNNGPVEGFANEVLFAPLHYLMGSHVQRVEVDLTHNRARLIPQKKESRQSLPGKVVLGTLSVAVLIPATLFGAVIKGFAQLDDAVAAKNARAVTWPIPNMLQAPSTHSLIHSALTSDLFGAHVASFLLAKEIAKVSCVSKACFKAVHKEGLWKRRYRSEHNSLIQVSYSLREEFQANYSLIKREYDPRVIDLFSSIDQILSLLVAVPMESAYRYPDASKENRRYGMLHWPTLAPNSLQSYSMIKGRTRNLEHFLVIRFQRNEEICGQKYMIAFYQSYTKKWIGCIRYPTIFSDRNNEFLTNSAARQWLKNLIKGDPSFPPPKLKGLDPFATYKLC